MPFNRPLKILEVGDAFFPHLDGVTHVIHHYALQLHTTHTLTVVAPKRWLFNYRQFPYRFIGIPALYIPLLDLEAPTPYWSRKTIKKLLQSESFDVIHVHSPLILGPIILPIAKQLGIPVITTLHSRYTEDFKKFIPFQFIRNILIRRMAKFYQQCDAVWTVNHGMVQELRRIGYEGPVTVMPNATEYDLPSNITDRRQQVFKRYHLNPSQPIGLFVGQQSYKKNIALTLQAIAQLKTQGHIVQFISVGKGEDSLPLKLMAKHLGISDQVRFTGKIMDRDLLKSIYLTADLFLFPSTYDASSLAVIEAAALGVPSILVRGAITAEAIIDHHNGYLTNETVEDYAATIWHAIQDPQRKDIAHQAQLSLTKSWHSVVEQVVSEYHNILEHSVATNRGK